MEEIIRKAISSKENYEANKGAALSEVEGKNSKHYKKIRNLIVKIFEEKESAEIIINLLKVCC